MSSYPWYTVVASTESLEQGDFVEACSFAQLADEVITAVSRGDHIPDDGYDLVVANVIILTQSCDLDRDKVRMVLVCPYQSWDAFLGVNPDYRSSKMYKALQQGNVAGLYLLNRSDLPSHTMSFAVADFRDVFSIPLTALKLLISQQGNRLRLLPPYREHMAQAFARFIMRVGLPDDIRDFPPPAGQSQTLAPSTAVPRPTRH